MTEEAPKPPQPPDAGHARADAPADALGAFEDALVKTVTAGPADTADLLVSDAVALGWQMAELYRPDRRRAMTAGGGDLPGIDSLDAGDRMAILVDQLQVHVAKLQAPLEQFGLPAVDLGPVRASMSKGEEARKRAVRELHLQLLGSLLAVDYRLGKSYGLGRALADLCRNCTDAGVLATVLAPKSIANLLGWLDDLSSALPPHSAHSVRTSLECWRDRAGGLAVERCAEDAPSLLRRQGELWRALLTGEKHGTEMLEIGNYLAAARDLAGRMHSMLATVIGRFWPLIGVAALLLAGGVALLFIGGSAHIVAGASSILVALGLTWKGLGTALGQLVGRLEQPVWGAVLDGAIAHSITLLPPIMDDEHDHAGRGKLALEMPPLPGASGKQAQPDSPTAETGSPA